MALSLATASNTHTEDVMCEQEMLLRSDTVIFQFPLWCYSRSAILKDWTERVYPLGFGYGMGDIATNGGETAMEMKHCLTTAAC